MKERCKKWDCTNRVKQCEDCVDFSCYEKEKNIEIRKARKFLYKSIANLFLFFT